MCDRETVGAELRATKGAVKPTSILSVTRIEQSLAVVAHLSEGIPRYWLLDSVALGALRRQRVDFRPAGGRRSQGARRRQRHQRHPDAGVCDQRAAHPAQGPDQAGDSGLRGRRHRALTPPTGRTSRWRCHPRTPSSALGLGEPISLGLPDGQIAEHEDRLADLLTDILIGWGARTWCAATWCGDGHPDHEAVGRAAAVAVQRTGSTLLEYPVWMWHWASPEDPAVPWDRAYRSRLHPWAVRRKRRAAQCFPASSSL